MNASTKRIIPIAVSIVCVELAALIMFVNRKPKSAFDTIPDEEMLRTKYANGACGTEYQTSKKTYFKYIKDTVYPTTYKPFPMACDKCG
jgi:hypothetical protein